ncbi:cholecystokinin-like [Sphaeramia orbicularis]|uniref:Cholecystokinin-like n=2 Tax=Sphaeramia orbicularis TaxID=375764 RepID=A0A672ZWY3_9TELE|nr:cholecystokinin-like [Sphaeramia orbicularis]
MNIGFCAFILLVTMTSGRSLSSQSAVVQSQRAEALASNSLTPPSPNHTHQARSVSPPGQMDHYNHVQQEGDTQDSVNQLLARLMSRKGVPSQTRSSLSIRSAGPGLGPGHRIKDRDYLGWMDFGRRSAVEYEYSS